MSEELIRAMLGIEEPDPDDPDAVYLDQRQATAVFILTRWWVPRRAVPPLFALADRKQPDDDPLMPVKARTNLAEHIYSQLFNARNDYGWDWKDGKLQRILIEPHDPSGLYEWQPGRMAKPSRRTHSSSMV
jgi:hypothetical protein